MGQGQGGGLAAIAGMRLTPGQLRASFPGWRIHPHEGRWWARRGGTVVHYGPGSLLRRVLVAATLEGLAEQLAVQEELDTLGPEELEAAWREARLPEPGNPEGDDPVTVPSGQGARP